MIGGFNPPLGLVSVVLADANVLYSRVLRDYLLYAAAEQLISIRWSQRILDEFAKHLIANIAGFDREQAQRLFEGMNAAFPDALVAPVSGHYQRLKSLHMPDPDDRHVVAAAVAAEADILCTSNTKHFPGLVMDRVGVIRLTPDELLAGLLRAHPEEMLRVHRTSVERLKGATDESTLAALRRAGAARRPTSWRTCSDTSSACKYMRHRPSEWPCPLVRWWRHLGSRWQPVHSEER